jgi:Helix-turn-helix domain
VTQDDLLYRFRLRVFAIAAELGNARAACRAMGIHPSTYYRWKQQLDRFGPEILRPRERRPPRMANQRAGRAAGGRLRPGPSRVRAGPHIDVGVGDRVEEHLVAEHRTAALLGQQRDRSAQVPTDAVPSDRDAAAVESTLLPVLGDSPGHGVALLEGRGVFGLWGAAVVGEHHRGLCADGELADEPVVGVVVAEDPTGAVEVEEHRQGPAGALWAQDAHRHLAGRAAGQGGVLDVDGRLLDRAGLGRIDGPATLVGAELKQVGRIRVGVDDGLGLGARGRRGWT